MSIELVFATPRKLPKARDLKGRVAVLDLAFASEAGGGSFETSTLPLIEQLGPRLAAWVDHHDSLHHARFLGDPRFTLTTKAEHGACPELITPELVERAGTVQTIVCHSDFDGLMSAAKWLRLGLEPYPGADDDARAVDTCLGEPSLIGRRIERAVRARPRDTGLAGLGGRHLAGGLADTALWLDIDAAGRELEAVEKRTQELAKRLVALDARVIFADCTERSGSYDKTMLLLLGQKQRPIAVVLDGDSVTVAAAFDSGLNFLSLLGLSGGMPTRVSIPKKRMNDLFSALEVAQSAWPRVDDRQQRD